MALAALSIVKHIYVLEDIRTGEFAWSVDALLPDLAAVMDLFAHKVVGWSMGKLTRDMHPVGRQCLRAEIDVHRLVLGVQVQLFSIMRTL